MPGPLLLLYVTVLLVSPVLARWRLGFIASMIVVVLELAFVVIAHRLMVDYRLLPLELSNPSPEHPKAKIVEYHVAALARDMDALIAPALAALMGGALSVVWSVGHLIWRTAHYAFGSNGSPK